MNAQEKLFREYEEQLDEYHKTLRLWSHPRPEAVYAVMTIPDAVFLGHLRRLNPLSGQVPNAQLLKQMEEGVTQALRWLTSSGGTSTRCVTDRVILEQASDFALHASDYAIIADFHMTYGHGWADIHVDATSRAVTFCPVQGPGPSDALLWHQHVRELSQTGIEAALKIGPHDLARMRTALSTVDWRVQDGHIHVGDFSPDLVQVYEGLFRAGRAVEFMPLPLSTDMLGFTIAELWSFFEAVTTWSYIAFGLYDRLADGVNPRSVCVPTQLLPEREFVKRVIALTHLTQDTVRTILDRLTYKPCPKADILLTPFLRSNKEICWSPVGIMKYRHERNLLKVMARGAKEQSDHAATVNGHQSRVLGRLIGQEFNKRGYQFKLDTPITAKGDRTDIDVLLYHTESPDEVLIVEAKALLAPDEISEVHDATQELAKAQDQVRCGQRVLKTLSVPVKQQKFRFVDWNRVRQVYGVVVSSYALPRTSIDLAEVPVLTYGTLRRSFRRRDFRRPSRFFKACIERPWKNDQIEEGTGGYVEVRVGDLTYRLPTGTVHVRK